MSSEDDEGYVLRVRGLPWSATKEEIMNFFSGVKICGGEDGIHTTLSREGRPSGEAYIEVYGESDVKRALEKHNDHMGHRYIEVFRSKRSEMDWVIKRTGAHQQDALNDGCVRLRGLPFGCSKEELAQFFAGLEIVPNGITLPTDIQGRSTGEAYVQFASRDIAEKAMGKHKEKIGHRYIEIFKSSLQEVKTVVGMGHPKMRTLMSARPSPYDRNDRFSGLGSRFGLSRGSRSFRGFMDDDNYGDFGNSYGGLPSRGGRSMEPMDSIGGLGSRFSSNSGFDGNRFSSNNGFDGRRNDYGPSGHFVHMRGLPFRAIQQDIVDFFRPLMPIGAQILYDKRGRPSGEADVEFATHEEAVKAMSRDKARMEHRYIELFLNSTPEPMGGGPGGFGNSVMGGMGGGGGGQGFGGGMGNQMGYGGFGGSSPGGRYGSKGGFGGGMGSQMSSGGGGMGRFGGGGMGGGMESMIGGSNYTAF
ncbi:heterogeneous nuclear ribonucleoprotein H3-like isoform X2 [Limulus polyphemus]|nr:heterogeneous nuclear ribonucleoprotein H3-like isoform X2 [Limulus polyphemus]XP_022253399.1 heterogeneous nuclear ribonucleoprotein H3-like isoform X2 [Limulus polyphemus]XP_022253404.1 heterogeneous nuclear ribonucleoprotein H3-like isoform X2 [Limulus polyphemus]